MSTNYQNNFKYILPDYNEIVGTLCFGSKLPRDTNIINKEILQNTKVAPGCYNVAINRCNRSHTNAPFNTTEVRFRMKQTLRTPSPTRYYQQERQRKVATSGMQSTRQFKYGNNTPGPGTYEIRSYFDEYSRNQPYIKTLCTPILNDICYNCNQLCNYDYWYKDAVFLCHQCWLEIKQIGRDQLKHFKKIRNCSFKHQHEDGTNAAIHLLSHRQLMKKSRLENYLNRYIQC